MPVVRSSSSRLPRAVPLRGESRRIRQTNHLPDESLRDMLRFLALDPGHNATVTREILRRPIPEQRDRPTIHVS